MAIADIIVGGLLLVLGRKLFWLFVAASGFVAGIYIATRVLAIRPEWLVVAIGLGLGVIGAVAAIVIQRIAIGVAGFVAGAYLGVMVVAAVGLDRSLLLWVAVIVGGIAGAVLVAVVFDWALILLSSLVGASAVMEGLKLANPYAWIGLLVLCVIGVLVQAGIKRGEKKDSPPRREVR
jgi:Domain of unknown function (DUF4203)